VAALMASPIARPLFHKAILMSGAGHSVLHGDELDRVSEAYATCLQLPSLSRSSLAALTPAEILAAQNKLLTQKVGIMPLQPVIDVDLVPMFPIEAAERGLTANIPILIGTTKDEWKLFETADRGKWNKELFRERAIKYLSGGSVRGELVCDSEDERTQLLDKLSAILQERHPNNYKAQWTELLTHIAFTAPALLFARAQAAHAPTFVYRFDHASTTFKGAAHATELPFVFGTYDVGLNGQLAGADDVASARRLSATMMSAWTSFAHSASPATAELSDWTPIPPTGPVNAMVFDSRQPCAQAASVDRDDEIVRIVTSLRSRSRKALGAPRDLAPAKL